MAAHREEIHRGGEQATAAQCLLRSFPDKGGLDSWPYGVAEERSGLATRVVLLAALGLSVSAASSQNQAPGGTKAFHATKDCSGFTGLVGAFCTFRSRTSRRSRWARGSSISRWRVRPRWTATLSSTSTAAPSQPAIASFVSRPGWTVHDLGRHGKARRVPPRLRVTAMRRSRSSGTGTGHTALTGASSVDNRR